MTVIEITLIVMAVTLVGFSFHLLYLMKDLKVLISWSVGVIVTQCTVYLMGYAFKWYLLATLPFYLFSVVYMLVKVKKRVNAAIKRIEEREAQEQRITQQEASHGN